MYKRRILIDLSQLVKHHKQKDLWSKRQAKTSGRPIKYAYDV